MGWLLVEFDRKYDRSTFDCGSQELNAYVKNQISQDVDRKANVPVLAVDDFSKVVGFYTLSASSIEFKNFPSSLKRKIAPYPVSVARIGRLAVDKTIQKSGLGEELLFHAIDRSKKIGLQLGIRAVVVDAKSEAAERFYQKYGFEYLQSLSGSKKILFLIV